MLKSGALFLLEFLDTAIEIKTAQNCKTNMFFASLNILYN